MTSRPWHIVRWFGFLAIGASIAIGTGLRFRDHGPPQDILVANFDSTENSLAAQAPRAWLATEAVDERISEADQGPAAIVTPESSTDRALTATAPSSLDPNSAEAERQLAELARAFAGYEPDNVQVRWIEERGSRRFVFSCDIPFGSGSESFVGEGPDPPSAARHALSRIRAWAAAPGETTLR